MCVSGLKTQRWYQRSKDEQIYVSKWIGIHAFEHVNAFTQVIIKTESTMLANFMWIAVSIMCLCLCMFVRFRVWMCGGYTIKCETMVRKH